MKSVTEFLGVLDTEEKRREYYTYDMSKESTLIPHVAPSFIDLSPLNRELVELAGRDRYGDPRIRIVWADSLSKRKYYEGTDGNFHPYTGKVYPFLRTKRLSGYVYISDEGHETLVTRKELVPPEKLYRREFTYSDLGVMKFVVEMKYTLEERIALGYYPKDPIARSKWGIKNGKRFADLPDGRGEYVLCFFIETPDKGYRDVSRADLDSIREIWRRAETESDAEYAIRKQEQVVAILALQDKEESEELNKILGDAIIRAQKQPINAIQFDQRSK